jgi:LacI family transcriptional regulator
MKRLMGTIKEVAERAQVSVGTVSNVLSGKVSVSPRLHRRVMAAIRQLDYHPNQIARSLKTKQTKMLGMVISDIANPFFPLVVRGAEDAAWKDNYLLITFNTDDRIDRERHILSVLRSRRVDGVLLVVAPNDGDSSHLERTVAAGIPIVCLDRIPPGIALDSVSVESAIGTRECVRHLVSMGHREIAIINGPAALETARERMRGYEEALGEAKLPIDPRLVREGDFRMESGNRLARDLLSCDYRPTAIFVANGMMTLGVLIALEELGLRCPEDVALAMYDDLPLAASFRPRLTAVAQDPYKIGYTGAELLLQRLQGAISDPKPLQIRLRPELKIRESSLGYRPQLSVAGR